MRELTDRELDSVCGGGIFVAIGNKTQTINNYQSNKAAVGQFSGGGFLSGNVAVVKQSNFAINANVIV